MRTVTELICVTYEIRCPHCNEMNSGYFGDIRGEIDECAFCEKEFEVHSEADIEMGY